MINCPLGLIHHFDVTTQDPVAGESDADAAPTFKVFEEDSDTAIVSGTMTKRDSETGNYRGTFAQSTANGFAIGKQYKIVVRGVVNSIPGKCVVLEFRCGPAEDVPGVPKTDVSHIGGVDQASADLNVSNRVDLLGAGQGDILAAIADVDAKTANLPSDPADQSLIIAAADAIMTRLGAPVGASISADIAGARTVADAVKAMTDLFTAAGIAALMESAKTIGLGVVDTAAFAPTTTQFEADVLTFGGATNIPAAADSFKNRVVVWKSGALWGSPGLITGYSKQGARARFTVSTQLAAPADNAQFAII